MVRPGDALRRAPRRAHRRARLPGRRGRRRRRRAPRHAAARATPRRSATSRSSASPTGIAALGAVAAGWRRRFDPLVVGVTGSIAKTSTKEAVAAVLGRRFRTLQERGQPEQRDRPAADAPARSAPSTRPRSSRWGCTSVARSPTWPRWRGRRSGSSPPSRRSTCRGSARSRRSRPAKGELVEALPPGRHGDPQRRRPRSSARMAARTAARVVTYGFADDADVGAEAVDVGGLDGMRVRAACRRASGAR